MPQEEIISGKRDRKEWFHVKVLGFGGVDVVMERQKEIMSRCCDDI